MPNKMPDYSEEQMADAFERRLRSRAMLRGVGRLSQVFREVECHRGRPDFVGIISHGKRVSIHHQSSHGVATARILSLLKKRSPRTVRNLAAQMDMTVATTRRVLRQLQASCLVEELSTGSFVLLGGAAIFDVETVAFELKLKNPRRAVFQAQQYTLFAQRVWIVIPPLQASSYEGYRPVLARWGIGLATFEPTSRRFSPVIMPTRRAPGSREHQAYAVLRLVGT